MIKVWGRATSINVQKVMWALGELELAYERIDVGGPFGGLDTEEMGRLNPNRLIPVIDDNGIVVWESNAIVRHFARAYGSGSLAPIAPGAFAAADQWMDWSITTIYRDIIVSLFLGLIRTPASERNMVAIEQAMQSAASRLAVLDGVLADRAFIAGDQLTVADIATGALMYRYYNLEIARPALPNVERWYGALAERPAYQQHVMIPFDSMKVPGA
ncbi:MAG: glutathione S-transferase [Rhizobiales bacterium]|nr:glutathione S-transferase [Hyphomicrobiales bacterium]